ncbi:MAG: terminase large subunit domain-containing protein [Armatimonadota bacterium]
MARRQPCPTCHTEQVIEPGKNECPVCRQEWTAIMPQEGPQTVFFELSWVDILIYGGAAGGGKTWALLLDPVRDLSNPGFKGTLFRRKSTELTLAGGVWDESSEIYPHLGGRSVASPVRKWYFPSGAALTFTHLNQDEDKKSHQGGQNAWQGWDELTHFLESQFWYLQSRGRSKSGAHVRTRGTVNPDGGSWVKIFLAPWVDDSYPDPAKRNGEVRWLIRYQESEDAPAKYNYFRKRADAVECAKKVFPELSDEEAEEAPKSVAFIEADLDDNQVLQKVQPGYRANLLSLSAVERKRLLHKDWNILSDTFFEDWEPTRGDKPWHVIPTGPVPEGYFVCIGGDWGFKDPCAFYLIAIAPDGRKTVCREFYARRVNTEDQGNAMIRLIEQAKRMKEDVTVYAGFDVFNRRLNSDGEYDEPIVQKWWNQGLNVVKAGHDPLNRANSMREHLRDWGEDEGWPDGRPGIQIMDCCVNLIRTLPLLKSDENKVEEVDTTLEDHPYDAVGHALTSAPARPEPPKKEKETIDRAPDDEREDDDEPKIKRYDM